MTKFATMGKVELRAACKAEGVVYGKLNNDGMREALRAVEAARIQAEAALAKDETTKKGLKIEKVREERNGIKRPSLGGKCRIIWDALDAYRVEENEVPSIAIARTIGEDEGWEHATVTRQYYEWRKFNGIGR